MPRHPSVPGSPVPDWAEALIERAAASGEDIAAALALSREYGRRLPVPGAGRTASRWSVLAEVARVNLTAARVLEAHTDALSILAESGRDVADDSRTWGVFAAEAPGARLEATLSANGYALSGVKPWCSLGDVLDSALVTAWDGPERRLFAVELQRPDVRADPPGRWVARGLRTVTSGPVAFDAAPAEPVGEAGWYLRRPGFAWGGLGVAACWHGGALGLADALAVAAGCRQRPLDPLYVGGVDVALHASASALDAAAAALDRGDVADPEVLALRTRAVVADAVESVLRQVGHALGPAALAFDAEHAARVADLTLYVRQHHGENDLVALGNRLLDRTAAS